MNLRANMTKPSLLVLLTAAVTLTPGCSLFRKSDKPKENPAIAGDVEATFRRRWVEKRVGELAAAGTAAEAARAQAEKEFEDRYGFGKPGAKK